MGLHSLSDYLCILISFTLIISPKDALKRGSTEENK